MTAPEGTAIYQSLLASGLPVSIKPSRPKASDWAYLAAARGFRRNRVIDGTG